MKKEILLISLFLLLLFSFLYFSPFKYKQFNILNNQTDFNFTLNTSDQLNLFYPNMRFSSSNISYKFYNCENPKIEDMIKSFNIIQNLSVLTFYPVDDDEEISIFCEQRKENFNKFSIAGEGGPTNITISGNFKIIKKGEIHLIKKSDCNTPNVAIHELLHVLGFNHSINKLDIMYNVTDCNQKINPSLISYLNNLYSIPSLPDLEIDNPSFIIHGRFLDLNLSIYNYGLVSSKESSLLVYENDKKIDNFSVEELCVGCGRIISLGNIGIPQNNIKNISIEIKTNEEELTKENNKININ